MNINAMVSQRFLMNSFTSSVKKGSGQAPNANVAFKERLNSFREENVMNKLIIPKDPKPDEVAEQKGRGALYSDRLLDTWDSSLSAEEALEKLGANLSRLGAYTLDGGIDPQEAMEHLAAQYTLYKGHINMTGSQEQRNQLDALVEKHVKKYAESFSEVVGGFFEENGMAGERERLYSMVLENVTALTQTYEGFIAEPKNKFSDMLASVEKDAGSLANTLRKTVHDNDPPSTLSAAAKLVKFAQSLPQLEATAGKSEEELGYELGKVALEALDFLRGSAATDNHKTALMTFVQKQAEQHLNRVDDALQAEADYYREMNPEKEDNPFRPLDRGAVFDVVEAMTTEFEKNLSIASALEAGKSYGLQKYLAKANVEGESARYRGSDFWQDVVKDALTTVDEGNRKYLWIQGLLSEKSHPWLNIMA